MWDVSAVRLENYDLEKARRALEDVLAPIGGLDWVKPGMKVAIKANLVSFMRPEKAATTHPVLLCALTEMLKSRGAEVVIGDSPGGLYTAVYLNRIYSATGMREAEAAGAKLNDNFEESQAEFPEGKSARQFTYTAWLDEADEIINFCKLKSHGMMGITAAVKNLFGVIPGTMKPEYHFKYPNEQAFADMLIDLNEYFHPRLCIVDAVVGMEGNGPTAGTPCPIGGLLASTNPYGLDFACAELVGAGIDDIPTLKAAQMRGLGPESWEQIHIIGDYDALRKPDFHWIRSHRSLEFQGYGSKIGKLTSGVLGMLLRSKPKVQKDECVGCAVCMRTCPAHAIEMRDQKPHIDRKSCIRCFCCQEFCPKGAMKVQRPPVARMLNHIKGEE